MTIADDGLFEGLQPETFEVLLTPLSQALTDLQRVTADPAVAEISIHDSDNIINVGFVPNTVEVTEGIGTLDACVELLIEDDIQLEVGFGVRVVVLSERSSAGRFIILCVILPVIPNSDIILSWCETSI